ncbi:hypothetical protein DAPPUDRAFT_238898 [Daphnia pulex]|uniref:Uncharacterized protein n=1 Tax=Daphnia pulex TaxID=6669 RepID=E9G7Q8_DAPPU|nr:hypothetical protein DAPPUDRAFT_238898 [Daphnia pulex]|eukprot:EFX84616.1 hypothetical protein DAPPUDRAFT_238898 [Daphnia pulex]
MARCTLGLSTTAVRLTEFCESRRLSVEAVHLAGVLNVVADKESRSEGDSSDWMLCRNTFDRINESGVKFFLSKPRKAQHNGVLQEEELGCPVCALESYVERTVNSWAVSAPTHRIAKRSEE